MHERGHFLQRAGINEVAGKFFCSEKNIIFAFSKKSAEYKPFSFLFARAFAPAFFDFDN